MTRSEILKRLSIYKSEHQKDYMLSKIGIFGSFARNNETDKSDIDIVVELLKPDLFILGNIKTDLELEFGKNVDIVRLRENMNQFLKYRIQREAIYV